MVDVYAGGNIRKILDGLHTLTDGPEPLWCIRNPWMQALLSSCMILIYRLINAYHERKKIKLSDGQEILMHLHYPSGAMRGVVLLNHTICGTSRDHAPLVHKLGRCGLLVVGFDRRGHGVPLSVPKFNTIGDTKDLAFVVEYIREQYPSESLYAIGFSAGAFLLSRYMGETGDKCPIDAAIMISNGFDADNVFTNMHWLADRLILGVLKQFWLYGRNGRIMRLSSAYRGLMLAQSMKEWHDHMHIVMESPSSDVYYFQHNPAHVLKNIARPTVFVNSIDDMVFPSELITPWKTLADKNPNVAMIHTSTGGHCGFFHGMSSWIDAFIVDFFISIPIKRNVATDSDGPTQEKKYYYCDWR